MITKKTSRPMNNWVVVMVVVTVVASAMISPGTSLLVYVASYRLHSVFIGSLVYLCQINDNPDTSRVCA